MKKRHGVVLCVALVVAIIWFLFHKIQEKTSTIVIEDSWLFRNKLTMFQPATDIGYIVHAPENFEPQNFPNRISAIIDTWGQFAHVLAIVQPQAVTNQYVPSNTLPKQVLLLPAAAVDSSKNLRGAAMATALFHLCSTAQYSSLNWFFVAADCSYVLPRNVARLVRYESHIHHLDDKFLLLIHPSLPYCSSPHQSPLRHHATSSFK